MIIKNNSKTTICIQGQPAFSGLEKRTVTAEIGKYILKNDNFIEVKRKTKK